MTFIPPYDFYELVSRGLIPGHSIITKFGRIDDVDTGTAPEDVWFAGGLYTGQPTNTPETVEIFSSSINDALGGSGMETARVLGLKTATSTVYEEEDIDLNGTTPVDLTTNWYRIFRAQGRKYGASGTNEGLITIRQKVTTANIFVTIQAGHGQTQVCAFTIPFDTKGYILSRNFKMVRPNNLDGDASIHIIAREPGVDGYNVSRDYQISNTVPEVGSFVAPVEVPALTDLIVRVQDVSDNNTAVIAELQTMLVKNPT